MEKTEANVLQSFNFLTEIYDVMKCFENNPSKLGNKINELKSKFDSARSLLTTLPGIDMSYTEQQEYYESLLKKYKKEKELLESYKEICKFDIADLKKGPSESFLNNQETAQATLNPDPITLLPDLNINETDLTGLDQQTLQGLDQINSIKDENLMELDTFQAP